MQPGSMAAIIGLPDATIEEICAGIPGVVPANYNSPGQVVISGEDAAIDAACEALKAAGAKRALKLLIFCRRCRIDIDFPTSTAGMPTFIGLAAEIRVKIWIYRN